MHNISYIRLKVNEIKIWKKKKNMLYVSKVNEKNTLLIKVIIKLSHSAKINKKRFKVRLDWNLFLLKLKTKN